MQNVELGGGNSQESEEISSSVSGLSSTDGENTGSLGQMRPSEQEGRICAISGDEASIVAGAMETVINIVVSQPESATLKVAASKSVGVGFATDINDKLVATVPAKKGMSRSESYHENCRVCQQQSDEPLIDLGCGCRGELAKAHLSCIEMWFQTRGSNMCEICQQVSTNVPSPESQPSTNYWIWRVDPAFRGLSIGRLEHRRGCFSPLWIAFCILFGGLLLDVLISVSLGFSAMPVNIIIGVIIVLGLGTALRLSFECCHEWNTRRNTRSADTAVNSGRRTDV